MGILTRLRNAFGRSRKSRTAEAEGAARTTTVEPEATTGASPAPTTDPKLPSPSPEPAPEPTASVPEPRVSPGSPSPTADDEHDLVSAAFDNVTVPRPTRSTESDGKPEQRETREPAAETPVAAEPKAEAEAEPKTKAKAEGKTEDKADAAAETAKPEPKPEPEAAPEPEAEAAAPAAEAEPKPAAKAETEAKPAAKADAKAEDKPDAASETPKPEPKAEAPAAEAEPKPAPKAEAEAEAEAKPAAKATAKKTTQTKATATAKSKTATKSASKTVSKSTSKTASKSTSKTKPDATPEPAAADGEKAPQGPSAPADESRTGGAGGNDTAEGGAEAEAKAKTTPTGPALPLTRVKSHAPGLTTAYKAAATALDKNDLTGTRAKVYLVLDRSASMRPYYKDGSAQALAEQTLALAAHLDPEATVPVVFFSTELDGTGEITLGDHENKIDTLHADLGRMGRTSYHAAVEAVLAHHDKATASGTTEGPALVVFQTDGAPDAKTPATQALTDAAKTHPAVHFSFVAFGDPENKAFDYLRKLKTPNTSHFLAGETPRELTDKELYEGVLANWRP
ncbi:VWA domain-containing protein [Streptomyces sp. NPDC017943]|uniref:VWA domain-containing protein n=1 Tax=Streptomyces sp. NPDC017943 TaxID=3365019 RepID=UPI0037B3155D